jgi:putative transposase
MTNHYHLLVETLDGNLSGGMCQLNGLYTQRFNRRHGLVGHLFQGRYKAILVQKEAYLLELARYVVLNPLRANMVELLEDWRAGAVTFLSRGRRHPLRGWMRIGCLVSLVHSAAKRSRAIASS